jgi:succinate dehydrogenase/fumarate reductase flavoprotein subunit
VFDQAFRSLRAEGGEHPAMIARELKHLMWDRAGVVRTGTGLSSALEWLEELAERSARSHAPGPRAMNVTWQEAIDVENQLLAARLLVLSALEREESRGAHFRDDFPERDDNMWLRSIRLRHGADGEPASRIVPVDFTRRAPERSTP